MRVGEQSTDPIDRVLGEVPLPAPLTPEDVRLAVRAVVVHTAEEWPTGPLCRNDGASYPCRLHRWGRRVLIAHGLNDRQVDALIRHGNPFVHVPFPFTATGPVRPERPVPHPTRGPVAGAAGHVRNQASRVVPSGVRPVVRAAGTSRPVAPPAAVPRWPRAS
ncbi:hypothetical protein [Micromonospora sp. WMMD812]|uniref:hypothetical protein n=1 Tax=Micromonospora sp. WMMD812 TaxID=3015152 RepID=UPI00248C9BDE|nr:hypothetical protein [Micromonospora sp. WMMD812]WBB70698.1 hypothetical protein O7603_15645 [Micromonospora sp. WMMD812]